MSLSPFLAHCAVLLFDSSVTHTHLPFLLGTAGPQGLGLFSVCLPIPTTHQDSWGIHWKLHCIKSPRLARVVIAGQEKSEVQLFRHSICNVVGLGVCGIRQDSQLYKKLNIGMKQTCL